MPGTLFLNLVEATAVVILNGRSMGGHFYLSETHLYIFFKRELTLLDLKTICLQPGDREATVAIAG